MSKFLERQTAEEVVAAYNEMSLNWTPVGANVDNVVLTLMATLRDGDVLTVLENLRSEETNNSRRVLALMVVLNDSPYGEGFEIYVRNAIKSAQEHSVPAERAVSLFRAELALIPGWERAAIVQKYNDSKN